MITNRPVPLPFRPGSAADCDPQFTRTGAMELAAIGPDWDPKAGMLNFAEITAI